jgi:hypothetical protein
MAFVPVPDCAEAVIHYLLDGQDVENTLWFEHAGGPMDAAALVALGVQLQSWLNTTLMTLYPAGLVANYIAITAQDSPTAPGATISMSMSPGGLAVAVMPNEVSLAIGFKTAGRGRGARGRNYLVALPVGSVSGNNVDAGVAGDFVTAYADLNSFVGTAGCLHIIAHRFSGFTIVAGKKVPTPLALGVAEPVTSYVLADTVVDAQRRRGPGRGR